MNRSYLLAGSVHPAGRAIRDRLDCQAIRACEVRQASQVNLGEWATPVWKDRREEQAAEAGRDRPAIRALTLAEKRWFLEILAAQVRPDHLVHKVIRDDWALSGSRATQAATDRQVGQDRKDGQAETATTAFVDDAEKTAQEEFARLNAALPLAILKMALNQLNLHLLKIAHKFNDTISETVLTIASLKS